MHDTANEDIFLNEDSGYTEEKRKVNRDYRILERMTKISKEIDTLGNDSDCSHKVKSQSK